MEDILCLLLSYNSNFPSLFQRINSSSSKKENEKHEGNKERTEEDLDIPLVSQDHSYRKNSLNSMSLRFSFIAFYVRSRNAIQIQSKMVSSGVVPVREQWRLSQRH